MRTTKQLQVAINKSININKGMFTRVNGDCYGNPRYAIHYINVDSNYERALYICKNIGGKFHNKQYGGGIVVQSYNLYEDVDKIKSAMVETNFNNYIEECLNVENLQEVNKTIKETSRLSTKIKAYYKILMSEKGYELERGINRTKVIFDHLQGLGGGLNHLFETHKIIKLMNNFNMTHELQPYEVDTLYWEVLAMSINKLIEKYIK